MKRIAIGLIFSASLAAAVAQTNAPTRALSLADCIAEALKHNFDVQVERYEPAKSLLNLHAAYAGYDPTFSLSATHSHSEAGGIYFGTNGVPFSDNNNFNSGLSGTLPLGTTNDMFGGV